MVRAASGLRSVVGATVDVSLAVAALAVVCYPAVSVGNALLGAPLDDATVRLAVGVVALGGAYPFVAGDWSLGRLGDYVFAFVVAAFAAGVVGAAVVLLFDLDVAGSDPLPQGLLFATAYLVAYLVAFRDAGFESVTTDTTS
ncbi:hypothetical protein ACFQH6_06965 [Halobacteriaceae archaeon GCM10025711]